jgi:hypothetical protein
MAPAYRIGKGPVVVVLEQFLATDDVEKWYDQLLDEATYGKVGNQTVFEDFLKARNAAFHTHLVQDVFGPGRTAAELPPDQLAEAEAKGAGRRLVYWRGLRRALEIAYGFGGQVKAPADRWTINVYWGCGQPLNAVGLGTDAATKVVTVIVYSDQAATGDDGSTVVARDPSTIIEPDPAGDLYFVDDRAGVGTVSEWRATRPIGFATSPA